MTTIDGPPGATAVTILDINDRGQMVGAYLDVSGTAHGFVRDPGGRYTTIDTPDVPYTFPWGINNRGQVAGFTTDTLPSPSATEVTASCSAAARADR